MSDIWVCSRWNTEPKDEEKWRVFDSNDIFYFCSKDPNDKERRLAIIRCDYIECPAPEQWERVEVALSAVDGMRFRDIIVEGDIAGIVRLHDGYRVVSLVVERRKS